MGLKIPAWATPIADVVSASKSVLAIAADIGVGVGTVLRRSGEGSKIQEKVF